MQVIIEPQDAARYLERISPLTYFAGAGASIPLPAGLPDANRIKIALYAALLNISAQTDDPQDWLARIHHYYTSRFAKWYSNQELQRDNLVKLMDALISQPLEVLVQYLYDYGEMGSKALGVLDVLSAEPAGSRWNRTHACIAKSAIRDLNRGHVAAILTTNFDNLIEAALEANGLKPNRDFKVCTQEEFFPTINEVRASAGTIVWLFKLHGSLDDLTSLEASLDRMRSRLSPKKNDIIRWLIRDRSLCFVGWRGMDWDINPVLDEMIETGCKPTFIFHDVLNRQFSQLQSDYPQASQYVERADGTAIICDANEVFRGLATLIMAAKPPIFNLSSHHVEREIQRWLEASLGSNTQQLNFRRHITLASLYEYTGHGALCVEEANQALSIARNDREKAIAHRWKADGLGRMGNRNARKEQKLALLYAKHATDRLQIAHAYFGVGQSSRLRTSGRISFLLGPWYLWRSIHLFKKLARIANSEQAMAKSGWSWSELCLAEYILNACSFIKRLHIPILPKLLANIARSSTFHALGLLESNIPGGVQGEATAYRLLGITEVHLTEFVQGEKHFTEALRLFRAINNPVGIAIVARDFATLYQECAQLTTSLEVQNTYNRRSLDLLHLALDQSKIADGTDRIAVAYTTLAFHYYRVGSLTYAIQYAQLALNAWQDVRPSYQRHFSTKHLSNLMYQLKNI